MTSLRNVWIEQLFTVFCIMSSLIVPVVVQPYHGQTTFPNCNQTIPTTRTTFRVSNRTAEKVDLSRYRFHNESHLVTHLAAYQINKCSDVLQGTDFSTMNVKPEKNGFVHTVITAYNRHHNLVIRPDDVWIAIATQFSFYANANAEKFRGKFVNFEGKKTLEVTIPGIDRYNAPHDLFVKLMTEEIHKNIIDDEVKNWILPNFTTTTDDDYITCGVVLMSTLKKYFNYVERILCGIPVVHLEGTLDDWRQIKEKLKKVKTYELVEWVEMLDPIIDQFIQAKEGKPDIDFWGRICHHQGGMASGPSYISGWITAFAVFDVDGKWLPKHIFSKDSKWATIEIDEIAQGIAEVDVLILDRDGEFDAVLFAGHMGSQALGDGYTLQPKSGWGFALKGRRNSPTSQIGEYLSGDFFKNYEYRRHLASLNVPEDIDGCNL